MPADLHATLLQAGAIPDPFFGDNAEKLKWLEEKEWWFATSFEPGELGSCQRSFLRLEGLDTFATIWLNGEELGRHRNMFRPAVYEVTGRLIPGENLVAIRFEPPLGAVRNLDTTGLWAAINRERVWMRKCQMNYGWDWAPRLPSTGIRGVYLSGFNHGRITDVFARTASISGGSAVVEVDVEAETWRAGDWRAEIRLGPVSKRLRLAGGFAMGRLVMGGPRLWWTHDLGEPHLYQLEVELMYEGSRVDRCSRRFGVRTLSLLEEPDPDGGRLFCFVLNGVKLFCKGANWVPADSLLYRTTRERCRALVRAAREANMNMLRVWGGGIYEDDAFYDACDEEGILIWQDFMFSCAAYPDRDPGFLEEVRKEAQHVVRRLRGHPSLALWCGNNENDWMHDTMFWDKDDEPFPGRRIYHELLPSICAGLDPTRPYRPSSPYGGDDHNSAEEGDRHNWQVWAGQVYPRRFGEKQLVDLSPTGVNYRLYARDPSRFVSEFGIQACPVLKTLRRNIPGDGFRYGSEAFLARIKDEVLSKKDLMMLPHTGLPRDLKQYEVFSMLVQAEGLKYGVEAYRRRKPGCSGALVWQLNDAWPGISWSVIDFYLNPKAAYYYLKRAFSPLLLCFEEEGASVSLWMINDTLSGWSDRVRVACMDFAGQILESEEFEAQVPPGAVRKLWTRDVGSTGGEDWADRFLSAEAPGDARVQGNHIFLREVKELRLPDPGLSVSREKDLLRISARNLARFLHIDVPADGFILSDNYFDLLPGRSVTLKAAGPLQGSEVWSYRSVVEAGMPEYVIR